MTAVAQASASPHAYLQPQARGIHASLDASFGLDGSRLKHTASTGSGLELRGPFKRVGEPPRYFLRNVTTGVFAGDLYETRLRAEGGATVWVSSSSATKVHEMPGHGAVVSTSIEVLPGATLLWGPHPTILQSGSRLSADSRWRVHAGGLLVAAEVLSFGRRASGEALAFAGYTASQAVEDGDGQPLVEEHYELSPGSSLEASVGGYGALASVYMLGAVAGLVSRVEDSLCACEGYAGAGELPSGAGFVVRALVASLNAGTVLAESLMRAVLQLGEPAQPLNAAATPAEMLVH